MGFVRRSFKATTRFLGFGKKATKPPPKPRNIPLQDYLNRAYQDVSDAHELNQTNIKDTLVPIAIFLEGDGTPHEYAGKYDDKLHFSGSLIKVAAMFAAFKLRKAARDLIKELKKNNPTATVADATAFFALLEPKLNLGNAVPAIRTLSNSGFIQKKPQFDKILKVTGFPSPADLKVEFLKEDLPPDFKKFDGQMRQMIVSSDNCAAGECIWRLSYPYINTVLMEDHFFEPAQDPAKFKTDSKGIWLGGDYLVRPKKPDGTPNPGGCDNQPTRQQPFIRLITENDCGPSGNDCETAQNTTAKAMAEFFFKILRFELVDRSSSNKMQKLLKEAQAVNRSELSASGLTVKPHFKVEGVKIGIGPLKPGSPRSSPQILSEGMIIGWDLRKVAKKDLSGLTGKGVICWQNLNEGQSVEGIVKILNTAIENFIKQAPI